jgi:drug/metabolite transporter (DMT)-like permease
VLTPELSAMAFGLLSAVSYGAGDFNGGLATRRMGAVGVVVISHGFGLVLLVVLALLSAEALPPTDDLLLGGVAGIAGMVGLASLYRALASGHMGIAAPISAVLSAALPVVFSVFSRVSPESTQIIGFVLAFVSVILISYTRGAAANSTSLFFAVTAGVGFGVFFIILDFIESDAIFWPLAASRVVSTSIMLTVALLSRRKWLPSGRSLLAIILLSSVLDVGGNVFFLMSAQSGRLDIASVVSSLYPAVTLLLARLVLKERFSAMQGVGVVLALGAVVLISA